MLIVHLEELGWIVIIDMSNEESIVAILYAGELKFSAIVWHGETHERRILPLHECDGGAGHRLLGQAVKSNTSDNSVLLCCCYDEWKENNCAQTELSHGCWLSCENILTIKQNRLTILVLMLM